MSDKKKVTYSVRMDEDVRQEIKDLIAQNGGAPEEMMTQMISAYKLNKAVSAVLGTREDVQSLRVCMASIESNFTSLLMRMESEIDYIKQQSRLAVMEAEKDARAARAQCDDHVKMLRGDLDKMTKRYEAADRLAVMAKAEKEDVAEKLQSTSETLQATQELLEQYCARPSVEDMRTELEKSQRHVQLMERKLEALEGRHKAEMERLELKYRAEAVTATEAHQSAVEAMQKEYAKRLGALGASIEKEVV